ncbi:MAG: DUF4919 domain-containing protein [Muribaculaceae bacterium]|jgi:hypothetical protein|nr:DUF4919 domain-containing protein [Muribaculaceae bacterium]
MGAEQFIKVDFGSIKNEIEVNPEGIKKLIARVANNDDSLKDEEVVKAYVGNSYLSENFTKFDAFGLEGIEANKRIETAEKKLAKNPLWVDGLEILAYGYGEAGEMGKSRHYWGVRRKIIEAMAKTGDGTKEHPYYVISIDDEYSIMSGILNVIPKKQAIIGNFDVFNVNSIWDEKNDEKLYFEISRVREIEAENLK